jgi:hypothetical protein
VIETGEKPSHFASSVPSQRAWKSYLSTKKAKNAIRVARQIAREVERFGKPSTAAQHLGLSRAMVCYHMALLERLPEDFIQWLEAEDDQVVWRCFSEHRLRPITKIADTEEQVRHLADMIGEAQALAVRAAED